MVSSALSSPPVVHFEINYVYEFNKATTRKIDFTFFIFLFNKIIIHKRVLILKKVEAWIIHPHEFNFWPLADIDKALEPWTRFQSNVKSMFKNFKRCDKWDFSLISCNSSSLSNRENYGHDSDLK